MGGRKEARRICQQRRVGPSCAGEDGDLLSHAFYDLINLFVVFNPTGIVPSYLYFTQHVPHKDRRTLAIRCVLIATVILVAFIVIGQLLLEALGIGLPAFKIAGGVVLPIISVKMILEDVDATAADDTEVDAESPDNHRNYSLRKLAVFPLATPLIAGPGGILVVVLLTDNYKHNIPEQVVTTLMLLVVMVLTCLMLLTAESIQRQLGLTGINVMSRISGLILAALSVETILDGLTSRFHIA
jgi:multiple antibiotic resistance protein